MIKTKTYYETFRWNSHSWKMIQNIKKKFDYNSLEESLCITNLVLIVQNIIKVHPTSLFKVKVIKLR